MMARLLSRLVSVAVVPAQIPGNVVGMLEELASSPSQTVASWPRHLVLALLLQLVRLQKLQLPDDAVLVRLAKMRSRYLQRGWAEAAVKTADGHKLDAVMLPPPTMTAAAMPFMTAVTTTAPSPINYDGVVPSATSPSTTANTTAGAALHAAASASAALDASLLRYVLFVGGNFQKYEDWLPYFDRYARDAQVGFLAFNFRGVARSEGAVCTVGDMVNDVHACVGFLLARGVRPHHILIHGFSIGGAVAALYLSSRRTGAAFVSDRSFRSLSHAAYAVIRQPLIDATSASSRRTSDEAQIAARHLRRDGSREEVASGWGVREWFSRAAAAANAWVFTARHVSATLVRVAAAAVAVWLLRLLKWDMDAEAAWPKISGKKVLVFHRSDSVVHYEAASLHRALTRRSTSRSGAHADVDVGTLDGVHVRTLDADAGSGVHADAGFGASSDDGDSLGAGVRTVEVTRMGSNGFPSHDFPLCADADAWEGLISGVHWALGVSATAEREDERSFSQL